MFDIIVCGSNVVDTFVQTEAIIISQEKGDLLAYPLGEKVLIKESQTHIGGGGINALATFTKHKLRCGYIGKFGDDSNGHQIFSWLKKNNITFLGQVKGTTGFSVVLDSQAVDRTILNFRGANNELEFKDIPQHALQTKWFYSSGMHEKSLIALEKLFIFMHNHGVQTALNTDGGMVSQGIDKLQKILSHLDVLTINKQEATTLIQEEHTLTLAKKLSEHGPSIIAITDGAKGITVFAKAHVEKKEITVHIAPAKNITIIETTGAGDAFASGFVSGLVHKKSVVDSALFGVMNAENVIQAKGAQQNIPTKQELLRQLKNSSHTITTF